MPPWFWILLVTLVAFLVYTAGIATTIGAGLLVAAYTWGMARPLESRGVNILPIPHSKQPNPIGAANSSQIPWVTPLPPANEERGGGSLPPVYPQRAYSADDQSTAEMMRVGKKAQTAAETRSRWGGANWGKYYEHELHVADQSHRDWWTNDEEELSRMHVSI